MRQANNMKIAVAGTGYVGLVTGVALANAGHHVTCVDVDEHKIQLMKQGISPIYEPDLEPLMQKNKERLSYTTDYASAYQDAQAIFVGVGTPERGIFHSGGAIFSFQSGTISMLINCFLASSSER